MATFGLIVCFIFIFVMGHIQNWLLRWADENNEPGVFVLGILFPPGIAVVLAICILRFTDFIK